VPLLPLLLLPVPAMEGLRSPQPPPHPVIVLVRRTANSAAKVARKCDTFIVC
jgi:hypothetical protein